MSTHAASVAPVVVMGVSGVGKSTVAEALARVRGQPFLEGDDFHPAANVRKMASGEPLDDIDRELWLRRLVEQLGRERAAGRAPVISCSALSRASRALLSQACPDLFVVFLKAPRAAIEARLRSRRGHFMPASLLDSQLEALEEPAGALTLDACEPVTQIVERIARALMEPR
jgi:gluconokinase